FETTDDAFIDGNVVRISPQVGGVVARLHFTDNQDVRKGDLLIEIDPRDLDARVAAAKAALDMALAERDAAAANLALVKANAGAGLEAANSALDQARRAADAAKSQVASLRAAFYRAQADLKHAQELFAQGNVTRPQLDQFQADAQSARERLAAAERSAAAVENQAEQASGRLEAAKATPERASVAEAQLRGNEAQVAQARALLRQAELNRSHAQIYAPRDGRIARKAVQEGDVVRKDQTLSLLIVGMPWVTANFKETQIGRMRLGQPAAISIDAYPGRPLLGHVESIQPGTDARFAARQAADAGGDFVKSVQRVPVKIELDEAPDDNQLLALGMSVVPTVMVQNEPEPTVRVQ
ncbi:MAG TPA: HlyD family secretion protein, partial [Candidatus Sulfotelmatobacter sp.]|nr:HlyD family secretion protein [Candidatus Sulfotelmatobacter sp.]